MLCTGTHEAIWSPLPGARGRLRSGFSVALWEAWSLCPSLPCWLWRRRTSPELPTLLCFPAPPHGLTGPTLQADFSIMPLSPGRGAFRAKQAWRLPMWHPNSNSWEQSSWEAKPFAHHLLSSCHEPNSKENGSDAWSLSYTPSSWREANTLARVQHVPRAHQSHQVSGTGEKLGHRG